MQSLLSPSTQRENGTASVSFTAAPVVHREEKRPEKGRLRDMRGTTIGEIQATLREYGVNAESHEIADALIEALLEKPNLCKGLFASYMLKV
jgi:hypothetical protein